MNGIVSLKKQDFTGEYLHLHYNQILSHWPDPDGPGSFVAQKGNPPILVKERSDSIEALCLAAGEIPRDKIIEREEKKERRRERKKNV